MWSSNHFSTSSCFPSFSGPDFLGSMFFRVQVFQGPCFSGSKFFRFPVFSGSRFFMVRVQVLEGARSKDYLEISASVSQHRYFFLTNFFFEKIQHLCPIYLNFLSFGQQLHGITINLLQLLITQRLPTHPFRGAHWCSRKKLFEFQKAPVHQCFDKVAAAKTFGNFPVKHPWWSPFQVQLKVFLGVFQKPFILQRTCSACFCTKKLRSRHSLRN